MGNQGICLCPYFLLLCMYINHVFVSAPFFESVPRPLFCYPRSAPATGNDVRLHLLTVRKWGVSPAISIVIAILKRVGWYISDLGYIK